MTEESQRLADRTTSTAAQAGPTPPSPAREPQAGFARLLLVPVAFVVGGLAEYMLGLDAVWPVLTGAVVTAVLVLAADVMIGKATRATGRHVRVLQLLAVLVMALGVGMVYRADRSRAFQTVFGTDVPAGVRRVDVERFRAHDTGRKLTIVQFEADRAAVEKLVGPRAFKERAVTVKPGREAKAQRGTWSSAFSHYGLTVVDRWKNRLPVTEPYIYHWTGAGRDTLGQQASVLWDADSGRGYSIHAMPAEAAVAAP